MEKQNKNEIDLFHWVGEHYFTPVYLDKASIKAFILAIIACFMLVSGLLMATKSANDAPIKKLNEKVGDLEANLGKLELKLSNFSRNLR